MKETKFDTTGKYKLIITKDKYMKYKDKIITGVVLVVLLAICYYLGHELGAAYDNVNDWKDLIAGVCGAGSVIWLIKRTL